VGAGDGQDRALFHHTLDTGGSSDGGSFNSNDQNTCVREVQRHVPTPLGNLLRPLNFRYGKVCGWGRLPVMAYFNVLFLSSCSVSSAVQPSRCCSEWDHGELNASA